MSKPLKKAGLVCDNYKVSKFLEELANIGYNDVKVTPFKGGLTLQALTFHHEDTPEIFEKIKNTLKNCEVYFAGMKN